jgi:hypothetical protein
MEKPPRIHLAFLAGFGIGSFVGVALALLAIALTQDAATSTAKPQVVVQATVEPPTSITVTVTPAPDARARTKTALDVKLGPGEAFAVIGTISRGEAVEVDGRDADSKWVSIRFPPGSLGRGWIPVAQLDGLSEPERFAVVLPTPLPRSFVVPTFAPFAGDDSSASSRLTPAAVDITPTPRVNTGPTDLAPTGVSLLADGRVSVVVANRGPGDLTGNAIFVTVRDLALRGETVITDTNLAFGSSLSVQTQTFRVTRDTEVQVIVDPNGGLQDPNRSNNTVTVTLRPVGNPTPVVGRE